MIGHGLANLRREGITCCLICKAEVSADVVHGGQACRAFRLSQDLTRRGFRRLLKRPKKGHQRTVSLLKRAGGQVKTTLTLKQNRRSKYSPEIWVKEEDLPLWYYVQRNDSLPEHSEALIHLRGDARRTAIALLLDEQRD